MNQAKLYVFGGMLLLFAGFTLASFNQALTPYVPFEQAQRAQRTVQVAGSLAPGSSSYDEAQGALLFTLEEPETKAHLRVSYQGVKPANFEEAISIVAIGRYDASAQVMAADKLLVKCPSKYQGAEVETKSYD